MRPEDVAGAVALQPVAFPPPFDPELHWQMEHLLRHIKLFPEGQFVAAEGEFVVASCSNTLISEESWQAHASWIETVGDPFLGTFDREGTTLYGLDISVHPKFRRRGIAKRLYLQRFELVRSLRLVRYGTACRVPGWHHWHSQNPAGSPEDYVSAVQNSELADPTLTPLLKMSLTLLGVIENYMEDEESGNAAALLEWKP